jgi:hypothetical protein
MILPTVYNRKNTNIVPPYDSRNYKLIDNFNRAETIAVSSTPVYSINSTLWFPSTIAVGGEAFQCSPAFLRRVTTAADPDGVLHIQDIGKRLRLSASVILGTNGDRVEFTLRKNTGTPDEDGQLNCMVVGVRQNASGTVFQVKTGFKDLGVANDTPVMDGGIAFWNTVGTVTVGANARCEVYIEDLGNRVNMKVIGNSSYNLTDNDYSWSVPETYIDNTGFGININDGDVTSTKVMNLRVW